MSDYEHKYKYLYSKYKNKYIALRNSMIGGAQPQNIIFENPYGGEYTMYGAQARKLYNFLYSPAAKNINTEHLNILKTDFIHANVNNVNDIPDTSRLIISSPGILLLLDAIDVMNGKPIKPWTQPLYLNARSQNKLPTISA